MILYVENPKGFIQKNKIKKKQNLLETTEQIQQGCRIQKKQELYFQLSKNEIKKTFSFTKIASKIFRDKQNQKV